MNYGYRIGIDLGGTKIEAVALDRGGKVLVRKRVATPMNDHIATVAAIATLVTEIEAEFPGKATVGIGTPGSPSRATGLMRNANSICLNGKPLQQLLISALQRPVRLENDANCFALSEAEDGAGREARVVFGVILGTGVGAGIVIDRHLLTGANAIAGEWGHNPLPWPKDDERPGPSCYCGRSGCIETFLSGPGISADHFARTGKKLAAATIVERAEASDPSCEETLGIYCDRLARGLGTVINVLDPDIIVLGGGLSNISALYDHVPRLWARYIFSDDVVTRLVPAVHGDSSGVRGAAWLWDDSQWTASL